MELKITRAVVLALLCTLVDSQICRDKYHRFPNHTMCLTWSHTRQDKHTEEEILQKHNDIRANVVPASANMLEMAYFKTLHIEAQIWAEQCTFTHDEFYLRFQPARYDVGQNILASKTNLSWTSVIEQWHQENVTFRYGSTTNNVIEVGNYTQIINADTRAVGCGRSVCNGTYFYVCNYAPRMEKAGLSKPYEESRSGSSCDACPSHCNLNDTSTLCSCEGKFCQNGGHVNLTTCECECIKGVKTYNSSNFCELKCEPNGDHPRCSKYNDTDCRTNKMVNFMCPWKCGICPWGDSSYRDGTIPLPWDCPVPANITNGNMSYTGFREGQIASYVCHKGYYMSTGNTTRVCHNDQWSGVQPQCHTLYEIQQMLKTVCNGSIVGSTSCPYPRHILHGDVTVTTYTYVKVAAYRCNTGYYIGSGNQTHVCENGKWRGMEPACHAITTPVMTNTSRQDEGPGCNKNSAGILSGSVYCLVLVMMYYLI